MAEASSVKSIATAFVLSVFGFTMFCQTREVSVSNGEEVAITLKWKVMRKQIQEGTRLEKLRSDVDFLLCNVKQMTETREFTSLRMREKADVIDFKSFMFV